jgi:hypothetical protein
MKVLLSGISIAARLTWGLPVWSPANAMTAQTHNEPGYNFPHPAGDADNVPVRAEVKYDGVATPAAVWRGMHVGSYAGIRSWMTSKWFYARRGGSHPSPSQLTSNLPNYL